MSCGGLVFWFCCVPGQLDRTMESFRSPAAAAAVAAVPVTLSFGLVRHSAWMLRDFSKTDAASECVIQTLLDD